MQRPAGRNFRGGNSGPRPEEGLAGKGRGGGGGSGKNSEEKGPLKEGLGGFGRLLHRFGKMRAKRELSIQGKTLGGSVGEENSKTVVVRNPRLATRAGKFEPREKQELGVL